MIHYNKISGTKTKTKTNTKKKCIKTGEIIIHDKNAFSKINNVQIPSKDKHGICKLKCFPNNINSYSFCLPNCYLPLYDITKNNKKQFDGLNAIIHELFTNKQKPSKAYFILGFGPPGSGKSNIIDVLHSTFSKLNITKKNTIFVNVDKIFQDTVQWKTQLNNISKLTNKSDIFETTQKLYSTYRYFSDQISDIILWKAIAHRYNVYLETNGIYLEWILELIKDIKNINYKIISCYPYVYHKQLFDRLQKRAILENQVFKPLKTIINTINTSLNNFYLLRNKIDLWVIIDNTGNKNNEYILLYIKSKKIHYVNTHNIIPIIADIKYINSNNNILKIIR